MKQMISIAVLCSIMLSVIPIQAADDTCDTEATSRSFLAIHPHFQSNAPEMISGFRSDRLHAQEDGKHGAMQVVIFGSKTTNDKELARYFFPFGKTTLDVREINDEFLINGNDTADLEARHFNIFTQNINFHSQISIEPEQKVIGAGLHWRQGFWYNEEKGRSWFVSVSTPITHVKNDLNLSEKIIEDGGGAAETREGNVVDEHVVNNMKEAFNQSVWKFGKIKIGSMKKTRLAGVELKLGYEWVQQEPCHLESYIGVVLPTGNDVEGEFLFEPTVGYGKHTGIMFGGSYGVEIWTNEAEDKHLRVEYNTHSQYLFKKDEMRSFDLKGKPWSRYIEVYESQEQAQEVEALANTEPLLASNIATPGINVFTQKLDVTPGFSSNINTGLVLMTERFCAEIGYNFFARRAECIALAQSWQEGPAIKHRIGAGQTNPIRDITGNRFLEQFVVDTDQFDEDNPPITFIPVAVANFEQSVIKESDLDLHSAATPCMLIHTAYGSLGYRWDDNYKYPIFAHVGGSYTFSKNNNAVPDRWTVWGKFGLSF